MTLKLACIQVKANDRRDADSAWRSLRQFIRAAAAEHDFVMVPEAAYPAYFLPTLDSAASLPVSDVLREVAEIAREFKTYIAFGYADGKHNAAILLDRSGTEIAKKDKSYLWHFDHRWFEPGTEVSIAGTEFGTVALVVCADARLTELVRATALEGAKLIIDLANLTASGPYANTLTNAQCEYMLSTRARENGVWLAVADKWDVEADTVTYAGRSAVYSPDGTLLVQAPSNETKVISVDIPVGEDGEIATADPAARPVRQPHLYQLLGADTQDLPIYRILSEAITPEFAAPYVTVSALNQSTWHSNAHLQHVRRLIEHEPHLILMPAFPGELKDVLPYQDLLDREQWMLLTDIPRAGARSRFVTREGVMDTYYTTHHFPGERPTVASDDALSKVFHCSFGYIGVMHEADGLVPEAARSLMLAGADMVVWQHGMGHLDALSIARTRAAENRIYVASVFSSALSKEGNPGASFLVDPNGAVVASTLVGRPLHATGAYCSFAVSRSKSIVPGTHVLFDRKPKNYGRLLKHELASI